MAFQVERMSAGILVVRAQRDTTAADHAAMLASLDAACADEPGSRVILDLSAGDYVPSADEARALAERVVDLGRSSDCRIAVVGRLGAQYGIARMVGMLSAVRDVSAEAFATPNEAVAWLLRTGAESP